MAANTPMTSTSAMINVTRRGLVRRLFFLRFLADADWALLCAPAGRCPLAERAADAERWALAGRAADAERWALAGRLVPEVLFREGSALRLEELALVSLLMIIST